MIPDTTWLQEAACAGVDPRAFYAEGHHAVEQVAAAKRICALCPVRPQCAEMAITSGEKWGVWGGMTQTELRQRRRRFTSRAKSDMREAA
ncbi:WhiB family transcriptional regulator [Streptomyces sp. NPDC005774]|uniref:WhiB family transcriptional regulator n=1 Tax=Streptomyces sp. NPDC005774 TaxID=3364728 RepID=UPI0036CECA67